MGGIPGRPAYTPWSSCSSLVRVLMSANASQSNVVSYKIHKPRPKGLSHNKMGPHAVLQLNPKPETIYEENMQPLINTSVDRRAEKGQAQAGQTRPGHPAPTASLQTNTTKTDFIRQSGAYNKKAANNG